MKIIGKVFLTAWCKSEVAVGYSVIFVDMVDGFEPIHFLSGDLLTPFAKVKRTDMGLQQRYCAAATHAARQYEIASATGISRGTVHGVPSKSLAADVLRPLPEAMDEAGLRELARPAAGAGRNLRAIARHLAPDHRYGDRQSDRAHV
ncbi:MAG: hypothetical protein OXI87_21975 [Albidovulum sp.]|nr:hypothetical protein [Albidovulum sp.]MDE0307522.1 hypothetical protein [Albidovulum sp.]